MFPAPAGSQRDWPFLKGRAALTAGFAPAPCPPPRWGRRLFLFRRRHHGRREPDGPAVQHAPPGAGSGWPCALPPLCRRLHADGYAAAPALSRGLLCDEPPRDLQRVPVRPRRASAAFPAEKCMTPPAGQSSALGQTAVSYTHLSTRRSTPALPSARASSASS